MSVCAILHKSSVILQYLTYYFKFWLSYRNDLFMLVDLQTYRQVQAAQWSCTILPRRIFKIKVVKCLFGEYFTNPVLNHLQVSLCFYRYKSKSHLDMISPPVTSNRGSKWNKLLGYFPEVRKLNSTLISKNPALDHFLCRCSSFIYQD